MSIINWALAHWGPRMLWPGGRRRRPDKGPALPHLLRPRKAYSGPPSAYQRSLHRFVHHEAVPSGLSSVPTGGRAISPINPCRSYRADSSAQTLLTQHEMHEGGGATWGPSACWHHQPRRPLWMQQQLLLQTLPPPCRCCKNGSLSQQRPIWLLKQSASHRQQNGHGPPWKRPCPSRDIASALMR